MRFWGTTEWGQLHPEVRELSQGSQRPHLKSVCVELFVGLLVSSRAVLFGEQQTFKVIRTLEMKVVSVESKCNLLLLAKVIVIFLIWRKFIRKFAFK